MTALDFPTIAAIGLLLWLAGVATARRAWRYAEPAGRLAAEPAMLALAGFLALYRRS